MEMNSAIRSTQVWGLIDCDAFFANCEIFHNPSLRDKIVCIWKDIVIARTYNAKKYGISIGTPVWEAKKILPNDTEYIPPSLKKYKQISDRLMQLLGRKFQTIEQFSIDEAFYKPLSQNQDEWFHHNAALHLQAEIRQAVWIPVSIGIAPTRILAKMFADINKPFWICVWINTSHIDTYLKQIPLKDIPFIWSKSVQKIEEFASTAYAFKNLSHGFIKQHLWASGLKIRRELRWTNAYSFQKNVHKKSISRSYSFNPHFTTNKTVIWWHLINNVEKALYELHLYWLQTQSISIFFKSRTFKILTQERKLTTPLSTRIDLIPHIRELFETIQWWWLPIRSSWIRLWWLQQSTYQQWSLFKETKSIQSNSQLDAIIDTLNDRYWENTIRSWVW